MTGRKIYICSVQMQFSFLNIFSIQLIESVAMEGNCIRRDCGISERHDLVCVVF